MAQSSSRPPDTEIPAIIALHDEMRDARNQREEPEPLIDFARRTGIPEGEPVEVLLSAFGHFAREPEGALAWVTP